MLCTRSLAVIVLCLVSVSGCSSLPHQDNSTEAEQIFQIAVTNMKMGQTEEALNQFLKIIQDYPKYSGPYANLGLIYEALGQKDKATEAFDNALALMPRSATIYNSAGLHYRTVGRFNDAESAYLNAIRIASDYPDPILNLAILYDLYLNEPDKAIIYYKLYNSKSNDDNQNVVGWLNDLEQRSNTLNSTNE